MTSQTTGQARFFEKLALGFQYLRNIEVKPDDLRSPPRPKTLSFEDERDAYHNRWGVRVDVMDATSSTGGVVMSASSQSSEPALYEKFQAAFEKECDMRIPQLDYKQFRGGAAGTLAHLPVYMSLNTSPGVSADGATDTNNEVDLVDDPTTWHLAPFCHVYLASCDSLEHYRTKVKPSIEVFISQLESVAQQFRKRDGGASVSSTATVASNDGTEVRYVIVFVPKAGSKPGTNARSGKLDDAARQAAGHRVAAFASRVAAARQRMSSNRPDASEVAGVADDGDADELSGGFGAAGGLFSSTWRHLGKTDREIARRLSADFPNGNLCVLSTLRIGDSSSSLGDEELHVEKAEWSQFTRSLGTAVAGGFSDMCSRYDEELRKLDKERGAVNQANQVDDEFDIKHFFLVKESLIFVHERMGIPSEGVLQYNELRAVLPDSDVHALMRVDNIEEGWLEGSVCKLRELLRRENSAEALNANLDHYIFARECILLLKQERAAAILEKCLTYLSASLSTNGDGTGHGDSQSQGVLIFRFVWDLISAANSFLPVKDVHRVSELSGSQKAFGCVLVDFVEIACLQYMQLGRELTRRRGMGDATSDLSITGPWIPLNNDPNVALNGISSVGEYGHESFVPDGLEGSDAFESHYTYLIRLFINLNLSIGRRRTSALYMDELAKICLARGDTKQAGTLLRQIADTLFHNRWGASAFGHFYRAACCYRHCISGNDYLQLLSRCFGENISLDEAPVQQSQELLRDLQSVVEASETQSCLEGCYIFKPILTKSNESMVNTTGVRKVLCKTGQSCALALTVTSFLPGRAAVNALKLEIVPYKVYISALEDSSSYRKDHVFISLVVKCPAGLVSGDNKFIASWTPFVPGQFVVAAVIVEWSGVSFRYRIDESTHQVIRVDVVPSDPTQSIQLLPKSLIPGHRQRLRVSVEPGTDMIHSGSLRVNCSPGVRVRSSDSDEWASSRDLSIPPCKIGNSFTASLEVECGNRDSTQSIHVKAATKYRPATKNEEIAQKNLPDSALLEHEMDAVVAAMSAALFVAEESTILSYGPDQVILNITMRCNSDKELTLASWDLDTPNGLDITAGQEDLNSSLQNQTLGLGSKTSFVFLCTSISSEIPDGVSLKLRVAAKDSNDVVFSEDLSVIGHSPLRTVMAQSTLSTCVVNVDTAQDNAEVGSSVVLSYSWNRNLSSPRLFQIQEDPFDWIICGQSKGTVDETTIQYGLRVGAVPLRPGTLTFPSLRLWTTVNDEHVEIPVTMHAKFSAIKVDCLSHDSAFAAARPQRVSI